MISIEAQIVKMARQLGGVGDDGRSSPPLVLFYYDDLNMWRAGIAIRAKGKHDRILRMTHSSLPMLLDSMNQTLLRMVDKQAQG